MAHFKFCPVSENPEYFNTGTIFGDAQSRSFPKDLSEVDSG